MCALHGCGDASSAGETTTTGTSSTTTGGDTSTGADTTVATTTGSSDASTGGSSGSSGTSSSSETSSSSGGASDSSSDTGSGLECSTIEDPVVCDATVGCKYNAGVAVCNPDCVLIDDEATCVEQAGVCYWLDRACHDVAI